MPIRRVFFRAHASVVALWNLGEPLGDSTRVLFYMLLLALIGIGDSRGIYLAYPIALPCLQLTLTFLRLKEYNVSDY